MGHPSKRSNTPAFKGSQFDRAGYCLVHPKCRLADPIKDENGKVVYRELKLNCPSCQSEKHKKKKTTSLGGGKVRQGRPIHGSSRSRSRSKSRGPSSKRVLRQYDTPFDERGRCHYHNNIQLATKKFGGGWKVLHQLCPKCMEENDTDDDRSVKSSRSVRSSRSLASVGGNAYGQHDKNGCCVIHPHIQVAKKNVFGRGWKVIRACPACSSGGEMGLDDDNISLKSGRSAKSTSSRKSTRSTASVRSARPGKAAKSSRYGMLPFDEEGFCCHHPSVQLAKKKALGGFKIIHHECPSCAAENGGGSRSRKSRRKSGTGRVFDDSGSEASSLRSGEKKSAGSSKKKKRIKVKNLKTEDEDGKAGRYSGYVDEEHRPHGQGRFKYEDGSTYEGVWESGSKVHGKTQSKPKKKASKISNGSGKE